MTVTPPETGCPWPVDSACFTAEWDALDPAVQDRAILLASETLRRLTGYRVGGCPITVRPCKATCANTMVLPAYWNTGGAFHPHISAGGYWVNSCGCSGDCSCEALCEVTLPAPVGEIYTVKLNGGIVVADQYRVDGNRLVWVGDQTGDCPWPVCQDLAAADDQPNTFSVTYLNSWPVDALGAYAGGVLAMEFARACTGNSKCRFPATVTSVTRQGVSFEVVAGSFPEGFTGIREVDAYIAIWNPNHVRQPPRVWSPDIHSPRVIR